ncbi:ribulose bisphosphate carboxylase small subunit [Thiohalophilus thiocyanatoxydans]|uniref:Ribulose bisphosphate carboxylase small subunit-like protein n=1 Tax=Thiohalophilus thiocyanatoxydans TaxID=381308 RepID=A0A4R8J146_9GAMM|nr:ribulose bisphosphate carboxylase small subunit [Thiohalophilus thiocyanatoxydans]TDY04037.1 ribulose bisphosphate carboxylase small subunit-like protein [Thiohalophilus thiocyanatoxydans]
MQLEQYFVRLTSLALFNKVENLVQQSLRGDWIVRIQYGVPSSDLTLSWQQWQSPFFALQNAKSLNQAILACRLHYPLNPVRLYAEKVRPESRFIYWIHTPTHQTPPPAEPLPEPTSTQPTLIANYQQAQAS